MAWVRRYAARDLNARLQRLVCDRKKLVSRIVAFREKLRKSFHGLGAAMRCERPQRPFATDGATQKSRREYEYSLRVFLSSLYADFPYREIGFDLSL